MHAQQTAAAAAHSLSSWLSSWPLKLSSGNRPRIQHTWYTDCRQAGRVKSQAGESTVQVRQESNRCCGDCPASSCVLLRKAQSSLIKSLTAVITCDWHNRCSLQEILLLPHQDVLIMSAVLPLTTRTRHCTCKAGNTWQHQVSACLHLCFAMWLYTTCRKCRKAAGTKIYCGNGHACADKQHCGATAAAGRRNSSMTHQLI